GNNDYFCINRNQVEQYSLGKVCRPLIARSVNINGIIFTRQDWLENVQMGTKTYLIDFPNIDFNDYDEKHKEYIKLGEDTDQNVGYKCKIRDRWYIVPSVRVSDGFFLRRNYLYPKFILNSNEINAVSTDTMHRVTFKDKKVSKRILLSYYNSIGLAFTEIEGRSYGGGVLEILPSEVGSIILPDLRCDNLIDDKTVDELIKLIDTYVRSNNDILGILDEIDKKVLVEILGLSMDMVLQFREIWINLRSRRLNRGKS
ncbi:MAG: class I SAM-dependent methyltransferase, partial [Clostridium sp.]